MLPKKLKITLKTIEPLFKSYDYMKQNVEELKQLKAKLLNLIEKLQDYPNEEIINLAKIYNQANNQESDNFFTTQVVLDAKNNYFTYTNINSRLLDYLKRLNQEIEFHNLDKINYSEIEVKKIYLTIKKHIIDNNVAAIESLLQKVKINLDYIPEDNEQYYRPLLSIVAADGNLDIIKILINRKATINQTPEDDNNLLIIALDNENYEIAEYLLDIGVNPDVTDNNGISVLNKSLDNLNFVEKLITKYKLNIKKNIRGAIPPLHYACKYYDQKTIEFLLNKKCNINALDLEDNTALHIIINEDYSVDKNIVEIIKLLIDSGINIDKKNSEGNTALHYAVESGNIKYTKILLKNGACTHIKNNDNETVMEIAENNDDLMIIKLIYNFSMPC